MSDQHAAELPAESTVAAPVAAPTERVGLGLLAALGAVVVGVVLTVVIWRLGFIASITSFAIAAGAIFLYSTVAGQPRKGLVPLVLLIVAGVVASFFAVVASDLSDAYDQIVGGAIVGPSKSQFIRDNIFNGELLREYGKDMGMFAVFAVLGIFSTLRGLFASR